MTTVHSAQASSGSATPANNQTITLKAVWKGPSIWREVTPIAEVDPATKFLEITSIALVLKQYGVNYLGYLGPDNRDRGLCLNVSFEQLPYLQVEVSCLLNKQRSQHRTFKGTDVYYLKPILPTGLLAGQICLLEITSSAIPSDKVPLVSVDVHSAALKAFKACRQI